MNEIEIIKKVLDEFQTIAAVGLASNPIRLLPGIAAYMQRKGCKIISVNPFELEVLGEKSNAKLSGVPEKIALVDVFRGDEESVIEFEFAQRAEDAGLFVAMERCWLKEHYRFK